MILFAILLLAALVVAVVLYKQGTPYMGWAIGAIIAGAFYVLFGAVSKSDRPAQVTAFEEAVAWKLANHISNAHGDGEVIVVQESILKPTPGNDSPSWDAQRKGVKKGLKGMKPVWKTLETPNELESGEAGFIDKRAQSLVNHTKAADSPVAIISFVPLDNLLNDAALKQLPPIYLFANGPSPVHTRRLERGEYGGVVTQKLGADFTKDPTGNAEKRFSQRFEFRTN